jgi:hypothetical protein
MVNGDGFSSLRLGTSTTFDSRMHELCRLIAHKNFCRLPAGQVRALLLEQNPLSLNDWPAFQESWSRLPLDEYMADGGRYRRRRYATFSTKASSLAFQLESHQPHYQSRNNNHLNGGVLRHFESIEDATLRCNTMSGLLSFCCGLFGRLSPYSDWHIEVHQFRIETDGGQVGLPTPEGIHRDGVSFVMMLMVYRSNVGGGETVIYDLDDHHLDKFTLTDPLEMVLVNDERIRHSVSSIAPVDTNKRGYRDVFVTTFRNKPDLAE